VITVAMSTSIGATRDRVWRALTHPQELIRWDDRIESLVDPVERYPSVGSAVRWRYRLGSVSVVLRERPREVVPLERLASAVAMGLFRFDETFTLAEESGDPRQTRLTLKLVARNSLPVVGGLLDRFAVRRLASSFVDTRLRAVQKWCENHA